MRVFLAAAAGFAALTGTAPAAAQFAPPPVAQNPRADQDIGWQLDEIYQTIEQARRSRRFSEPEARALHREGQRLFDQYQFARRDGIDRYEFRELDEGARALRERIERRLRFGDWRDGRDDGLRTDRPFGDKDWQESDRRWPDLERNRDNGRDDAWIQGGDDGDESWRDEPVATPRQRDEDWTTAPSRNWQERDEPAAEDTSPGAPDEEWWLPPEERESIGTRPGDRPPGSGGDDD